jgi:hypothetical protein
MSLALRQLYVDVQPGVTGSVKQHGARSGRSKRFAGHTTRH